jgi:hypothetical protein
MSEQKKDDVRASKLAMRQKITTALSEIDDIAKPAMAAFDSNESVADEVSVAFAIRDMMELLTPEVMLAIEALMNTSLGFKTDKDPTKWDKRNNCYQKPYGSEVVKRCFIESRLRGFHVIGNEWNILVGQFFACQQGLARRVKEKTGGTFEWSNDSPVFKGNQATIKVRGWWFLNDKKFTIGIEPNDPCEFSINVFERSESYEGTTPAAVVGKAYRMLLSRVFARITGRVIPAGEEGDIIDVPGKEAPAQPRLNPVQETIPSGPRDSEKANPPAAPEHSTASTTAAATNNSAVTQEPPSSSRPQLSESTEKFVKALDEAGVTFQNFREFQSAAGMNNADSWGDWIDVPDSVVTRLKTDAKGMTRLLKMYSKR